MKRSFFSALAALAVVMSYPGVTRAAKPAIRTQLNLEQVQGILAVQGLDGWLLYDYRGQNPIAAKLVNPSGELARRWFYYIPATGQPTALFHRSESDGFRHVPGIKIAYNGYRDLRLGLRNLLQGARRIAMEYSAKSAIPSIARVDAGTIELVRSQGVKVTTSADLVQLSQSLWGREGRVSHYVAVHHLDALRKDALAYVADAVRRGESITERDVQLRIVRGYKVRGLIGPPPIVAVNENSADPDYRPTREHDAPIRRGDLLLIELWARVEDSPRPIYADISWVAYVGASVPEPYAKTFAIVARARDATVSFIEGRIRRRRAVRGFEADQKARSIIAAAGFANSFVHSTGHSIDTEVHGHGANLDDYETHDTRTLAVGSGFSIAPGIYREGSFGMRSEINVYLGPSGVEITTPVQARITPLLAAPN